MSELQFGWHMPSCPVDGSSASVFVAQVHQALQHIQPRFDSVWVDDHVVPGSAWLRNEIPYLECLTTIVHLASSASFAQIWHKRLVPVLPQSRTCWQR